MLLGIPPSEVMELSVYDFDLLREYWEMEPWGPLRDNLHAGIVASTMINIASAQAGKKGNSKASNFLLEKEQESKSKGTHKVLSIMRTIGTVSKKKFKRKDSK